MHKHNVTTQQVAEDYWFAYDKDPNHVGSQIAKGKTEDLAVSNWWALYGSVDAKHPRKYWEGYISTQQAINPEAT